MSLPTAAQVLSQVLMFNHVVADTTNKKKNNHTAAITGSFGAALGSVPSTALPWAAAYNTAVTSMRADAGYQALSANDTILVEAGMWCIYFDTPSHTDLVNWNAQFTTAALAVLNRFGNPK